MTKRFSHVGFILAAAGSAVGLGNVWKFPYMTGANGGGAFVLVYIFAILFVGVSIFLAEVTIGRMGRGDSVSSFRDLATKHKGLWKYAGFISFTPLLIVSFYAVVMGWLIKYVVVSFGSLPENAKAAGSMFGALVSGSVGEQILYFTIAFFAVFYIVSHGIIKGIEKANVILMPLLFIILVGLMIYAMQLDGFSKAVGFLFVPDFSKLQPSSLLAALGQAFFTLSLGVGTIMTYASSLPENNNLFRSSLMVAFLDTIIALIAGIMIFSFTFHFGIDPSGGPGLIFQTMPTLFGKLGLTGHIISTLFFIALVFAGVTSAISMIEPATSYMENYLNFTRKKALYVIGAFVYIVGVLALCSNIKDFNPYLSVASMGFFDILDFITSSILMPIGGLLITIFVGYVMDKDKLKELFVPFMGERIFSIWMVFLRYFIPVIILVIMLNKLFFD